MQKQKPKASATAVRDEAKEKALAEERKEKARMKKEAESGNYCITSSL